MRTRLEVGSHVGGVHCGSWCGGARAWLAYSTRAAAADGDPTAGPARRAGPPGSVHRALPVPAGEQRVARVGVPACRPARPAPRPRRARRRQTRVRTARGSAGERRRPATAAAPSAAHRGVGEVVEVVGVVAQQVGRAGQRRGDPGPEVALEVGAGPGGPGPARRPGPRSAGRPTRSSPSAARRPRRLRPGHPEQGPAVAAAARPASRTSDRAPEPRARPSSTCSAWSSRVCPSRTAAAPSRSAAASRAA